MGWHRRVYRASLVGLVSSAVVVLVVLGLSLPYTLFGPSPMLSDLTPLSAPEPTQVPVDGAGLVDDDTPQSTDLSTGTSGSSENASSASSGSGGSGGSGGFGLYPLETDRFVVVSNDFELFLESEFRQGAGDDVVTLVTYYVKNANESENSVLHVNVTFELPSDAVVVKSYNLERVDTTHYHREFELTAGETYSGRFTSRHPSTVSSEVGFRVEYHTSSDGESAVLNDVFAPARPDPRMSPEPATDSAPTGASVRDNGTTSPDASGQVRNLELTREPLIAAVPTVRRVEGVLNGDPHSDTFLIYSDDYYVGVSGISPGGRSTITYGAGNSYPLETDLLVRFVFVLPNDTRIVATSDEVSIQNDSLRTDFSIGANESTRERFTLEHLSDSDKQVSFRVEYVFEGSSPSVVTDSVVIKPTVVTSTPTSPAPVAPQKPPIDRPQMPANNSSNESRHIHVGDQPEHPFSGTTRRVPTVRTIFSLSTYSGEETVPLWLFVRVVLITFAATIVARVENALFPDDPTNSMGRFFGGLTLGLAFAEPFGGLVLSALVWVPCVAFTIYANQSTFGRLLTPLSQRIRPG